MPHDGLYIRRNAAYGTRQSVGIKNLIDQGVQLEHELIRFDDFVDHSTVGILRPSPGQALAVSYGTVPIPDNQRRYPTATHYLEIALRAAEKAAPGSPQRQPPAVNYQFVVDWSGSMEGAKLDSVKIAIRELLEQMRPEDILGVVAFNDTAVTVLKSTRIRDISSELLGERLSNLSANGGTDINIGLLYGVDEINRYRRGGLISQLYLFSDGQPTSGETNWIRIRQNFANKAAADVGLSTMAFGLDANQHELELLAGITGGGFDFVTDPEKLEIQALADLKRRQYLAAMNLQLQLVIDADLDILHFYGHDLVTDQRTRERVLSQVADARERAAETLGVGAPPDLIREEEGIRLAVPDLALGETYLVVLEVAMKASRARQSLGTVALQYSDVFAQKNTLTELDLAGSGNLEPALVAQHALQLHTSEVVFYALDDLYAQDANTAKTRLDSHIAKLASLKSSYSEDQIADDRVTLGKLISLIGNLGLVKSFTDASGTQAVTYHQLRAFGEIRNGYHRVKH